MIALTLARISESIAASVVAVSKSGTAMGGQASGAAACAARRPL